MMRYVGMAFGLVFGIPYMLLFDLIRIGDLYASGRWPPHHHR